MVVFDRWIVQSSLVVLFGPCFSYCRLLFRLVAIEVWAPAFLVFDWWIEPQSFHPDYLYHWYQHQFLQEFSFITFKKSSVRTGQTSFGHRGLFSGIPGPISIGQGSEMTTRLVRLAQIRAKYFSKSSAQEFLDRPSVSQNRSYSVKNNELGHKRSIRVVFWMIPWHIWNHLVLSW